MAPAEIATIAENEHGSAFEVHFFFIGGKHKNHILVRFFWPQNKHHLSRKGQLVCRWDRRDESLRDSSAMLDFSHATSGVASCVQFVEDGLEAEF